MTTDSGKVVLDMPRERTGSFDPLPIAGYRRRFPEFAARIVSMYARGMTTREIRGHIEEIHGFEASPGLIPAITDAVKEDVGAWRNRPLEPCYPVVFMDAVRVNIRSDGRFPTRPSSWSRPSFRTGPGTCRASEGAKFRARVLNDLRGVQDILIAVVDGLKGFARAIEAAFPRTYIVHLLCHSMSRCAGHKDRNAVAAALKAVYTAVDAEPAEAAPVEFEESDLAKQYPAIAPNRRRAWNEVIPFLGYPPGVRRPGHTTNAIKALNSTIRRAVRTRGGSCSCLGSRSIRFADIRFPPHRSKVFSPARKTGSIAESPAMRRLSRKNRTIKPLAKCPCLRKRLDPILCLSPLPTCFQTTSPDCPVSNRVAARMHAPQPIRKHFTTG